MVGPETGSSGRDSPHTPAASHSPQSLFHRHHETLERALQAVRERTFWTPYPESPSRSVYGATAREDGLAAFTALLGTDVRLPGLTTTAWVDGERSPYGLDLGVRYPAVEPGDAVTAARAALPPWRDAGADARAGVCLEILHRLNARSFELAHAGMHTTGQPFVMAFQATGPHAQDRGLEAVARAYAAMMRHTGAVTWDKQTSGEHLRVDKDFHVVPRGVAAVLCCSTFPTWNSYAGLFASLVTGNPVVVKPHPRAVLPLALTVRSGREVLVEAGFSPELLSLVVDRPDRTHAVTLATDPRVRLVDYTGSGAFGSWLEDNARQARVYAEKSGINSIVVDSTDDAKGMFANIAFSLSLYSGQMCTAPQTVFLPAGGVDTGDGHLTYEQAGAGIVAAVEDLTGDPARRANVLGVIGNPRVLEQVEQTASAGRVLLPSTTVRHPEIETAEQHTPLVMAASAAETDQWGVERFGPISFVVATEDTTHGLSLAGDLALTQGALTLSVYSTSPQVQATAVDVAIASGVSLSLNLTGELFVNQSAAFSDYHGTGMNPAAGATMVDDAFVSDRFAVVEVRRPCRRPPVDLDAAATTT